MSFSFTFSYDDSLSSSVQGQLSSSYTTELTNYLKTEGADYVAFLAYVANGGDIDAALALKAEVESGNFLLSDLFSAAQSKTGEVLDAAIDNPEPKLVVTFADGSSVTIDLTTMFTGTDTESWTTASTSKVGKITTTSTTYHTREFFSAGTEPADYDANWAVDTAPPVAQEITVSVDEYDEHANGNSDSEVLVTVDLLSTASDPDGDLLSVVVGSVTLANGAPLPDYMSVSGNTLSINTNSDEFNTLYNGDPLNIGLVYQITDGTYIIPNTVALTIIGTADQFHHMLDTPVVQFVTMLNTDLANEGLEGVFNVSLAGYVDVDAFDFSGEAVVTVQGDINDEQNESATVILSGGDGDTFFADYTGGTFNGPERNNNLNLPNNTEDARSYTSETTELDFAATEGEVSVSYDTTGAVKAGTVAVTISEFDYWL